MSEPTGKGPLDLFAAMDLTDDTVWMVKDLLTGADPDVSSRRVATEVSTAVIELYSGHNDKKMLDALVAASPMGDEDAHRARLIRETLSCTEPAVRALAIQACVITALRVRSYWEIRAGGIALAGIALGTVFGAVLTAIF